MVYGFYNRRVKSVKCTEMGEFKSIFDPSCDLKLKMRDVYKSR